MSEQILEKIKSKAYWRIIIRPMEYNKYSIESLSQIREVIQENQVKLSGWNYPHTNQSTLNNGHNFVESSTDFSTHIEYWKFFQSGQFAHLISMGEDWLEQHISLVGPTTNPTDFKGLEILNALYLATEIVEFATRLALKGIYNGKIKIQVTLFDTIERKLFFTENSRTLFGDYICQIPEINWEKDLNRDELIGGGPDIALQLVRFIFERFNWSPPLNTLKEEQTKFLNPSI
ncbi:hypothetical protein ACUU9X_16630 [Bacillus cereus]|uniref:hypothetical protein n=1 Tax=Bacillus cereus TaxID=1396 RepID=UPI0040550B4C